VRSDHWLKTAADTPLRELVAGLDAIGSAPIPYARMPVRARTAFGAEFSTWADIAGETVQSLLSYPYAGDATVLALVAAAEDTVKRYRMPAAIKRVGAVAATRRLLDELDDADRRMLSGRLFGPQQCTIQDIAEQIGVHWAWVSRHLPRAQARFAELLTDPAHREVEECARELAGQLGSYTPAKAVTAALRQRGIQPGSEVAHVLLYVGGPYTPAGEWWQTEGGQERAAAAADAAFARYGAPPAAQLHQVLEQSGMTPGSAAAYASSHLQVKRYGGKYVPWGDTAAVRAEAVLHMRGTPATVDEILSAIGSDIAQTEGSLKTLLYKGDRFIRTSRRRWGLRVWDVEEYSGIADAIGARIDRAGGSIRVDELTADVLASFPDIAEASVFSYTHTLAFIIKDGIIRRRKAGDRWPKVPDLNSVRGAFRNGDNEIRLSIPVERELLRGSGLALPVAAAAALGIKPSGDRQFAGPQCIVRVTWPLTSTHGARVGSLREAAGVVSAKDGDTLVLAFDTRARTFGVEVIRPDTPIGQRMSRHLGHRDVTDTALSEALDCNPDNIERVLRRRGDDALADYARTLVRRGRANRSA